MRYLLRLIALIGAVNLLISAALAQDFGALSALTRPLSGRLVHISSNDPKGGNADARPIRPGETLTLVDYKGTGEIRRWWVTVAPRANRYLHRQLIVRCYWDGETEPSVEVPLGDFFGEGFGESHDFISAPLAQTSGGYNCYWAMPFRTSARITVENRSKVPVGAFYYNIDLLTNPQISGEKDALYFHAQFRRTNPTIPGKPVTLLEATGRGHYVGTLLSMQSLEGAGLGFLEGDEQVRVDGEATPSVLGTGTEDYFSSGWYFDRGTYSAPYHGITIKDTERGRISAYRWHIPDPIPFTRSLRFDIEHGAQNDRQSTDYTSVAFWYQTHPHATFPPLPADLLPVGLGGKVPGMVEGESLVSSAKVTTGPFETQAMTAYDGEWSGESQLFWRPTAPGAKLTFPLTAPRAGEYDLFGAFTQANDYGDIRVSVNGVVAGTFSGYGPDVRHKGPVRLGRVPFREGANDVTVEVTGKDSRSLNYFVGIDGFLLKP